MVLNILNFSHYSKNFKSSFTLIINILVDSNSLCDLLIPFADCTVDSHGYRKKNGKRLVQNNSCILSVFEVYRRYTRVLCPIAKGRRANLINSTPTKVQLFQMYTMYYVHYDSFLKWILKTMLDIYSLIFTCL